VTWTDDQEPHVNPLFCRTLAIVALAVAGAIPAVAADSFPSRPIRVVLTSAAGGALDVTTRLVAKHMGDKLGQQVIVDNRPGAGGLIAIRAAKAAPADGYTLLAGVNTVAIQQSVAQDPGYELTKDFMGVGPLTRSPFLLVAPAQSDKSVSDLLKRAKAAPGKLTYASAGNGSSTHLAAALFGQRAGVDMTHVPYKGNSAAWPDVIAGRVDLIMEGYGSGLSMIREGRLKALGVTSTKRLEVLPDVPTIAEQGVPGYSFYFWIGLLAPAGTPQDVVQKLSAALRSALTDAELKERFRSEGAEPMLMTPAEFDQFLKGEVAAMAKLVADVGVPKQ
jgi:tripartite-type tricarboxylate transporter receptor subunit TctC